MDSNTKIISYIFIALTVFLLFLSGCTLWGSPGYDFVIENRTKEMLTVYVDTGSGIKLKSGEKYTYKGLMDKGKFKIVAKNDDGNTLYSKELDLSQLDDLNRRVIIMRWSPKFGQVVKVGFCS
jgi:hypothetical protein